MTDTDLTLESFTSHDAQDSPHSSSRHRKEIDAAWAAGKAAGMAQARALGLSELAAATSDLATALHKDETRYLEIKSDIAGLLSETVSSLVKVLAPAYRAELLAEHATRLLMGYLGETRRLPPVLGCEAASQEFLRAALDEVGLGNIAMETIDTGVNITFPEGMTSIDLDRLNAEIIDMIGGIDSAPI